MTRDTAWRQHGDSCTNAAYMPSIFFHGLASSAFDYCSIFFTHPTNEPVAVDQRSNRILTGHANACQVIQKRVNFYISNLHKASGVVTFLQLGSPHSVWKLRNCTLKIVRCRKRVLCTGLFTGRTCVVVSFKEMKQPARPRVKKARLVCFHVSTSDISAKTVSTQYIPATRHIAATPSLPTNIPRQGSLVIDHENEGIKTPDSRNIY